MASSYTSTLETAGLDALRKRAKVLDGAAIEWGVVAPAPRHTGRSGSKQSGTGVTTAFTLARVEFGVPRRSPKPRAARRRGGLLKRARATLGKLLGGFRGRRTTRGSRAKASKPQTTERPVLRWVASARRRVMVKQFKAAALRTFDGRDPAPQLDLLGQLLAAAARDRLQAVGGVVRGQTKRSITYKVTGD